MVDATIEQRREASNARFARLAKRLEHWEAKLGDRGSVYAIGSYGRAEASEHSDLDIFLVGNGTHGQPGLKRLEQIELKASIIADARIEKLPEFSNDGEFLQYYEASDLIDKLGRPDDEQRNTLTARLLLLLESRVLVGARGYQAAVETVIGKYWNEFAEHRDDFKPMFLTNDILRLWRTFCLNYEARTKKDPPEQKAKRKLKNYKLKHSRLMTCFSAIAYLLAIHSDQNTVRIEDAKRMASLTPVERVSALADTNAVAAPLAHRVLDSYAEFLRNTDHEENALLASFGDREKAAQLSATAHQLGEAFFRLLQQLGGDTPFYRALVV